MTRVDRQLNPIDGPSQTRFAYSMRARGRKGLPEEISLEGKPFRLVQTLKHDFYAATALYADDGGTKAILKIGRDTTFYGFPLTWVGRRLCNREVRFYEALADLPNLPRIMGRVGETGFVHSYVEGNPLSKERPVPDGFFKQLEILMDELHRRDIAYVDTNKPQNILVADDGKPYLIDFQISYDFKTFGNHFASRWLMRKAKREDSYHLLKHMRRMRPDEMTEDELARSKRVSTFIHVHRFLTRPYFLIRRALFKKLRASGKLLPEGSK